MLWSLIKVIIFVTMVAAITYGAVLLLETEGGITIGIAGIELTLAPLQAAIALVVLILAVWLFLKVFGLLIAVLRFINGDETAFSRYFDRSRERRGFEAMSEGLMLLASGEHSAALTKAKKADRLLDRPELTNLIVAQAAEQSGDARMAEETYKKLLTHPKTRFVGIQGLLKQKLLEGNTDTAMKLAEKAFALKPQHENTQDTLLRLQAGEEDWAGARVTINAKLKHGQMPRDLHKRRDGIMALSEAREMRQAGKLEEAQALAVEANRLTPQLVPAAVLAARGYLEADKPKLATRVLKAAWDLEPHPETALAYAGIAADETSAERIKRFKYLTKSQAKHPESRMAMAELHIMAENFPAARTAMDDLATADPTMRSLTIMAAIERGEGANDQIVRDLLTQAINAPRDPQWICDNCGEVHKDWEAVCQSCAAVDSIAWKRPPAGETIAAPMMPLLTGPDAVEEAVLAGSDDVVVLELPNVDDSKAS